MDVLAIGKVGGSHGVAGYMKVASLSGETKHFFSLKEVVVRKDRLEKTLQVEKVKLYRKGAVLIKFRNIDTPEEGKRFTHGELMVPRKNCSQLSKGEYYIADLCQCIVKKDGDEIGTVEAVCNGSQAELLEVRRLSDKKTVYIPFMHQYVGEVDTEKKTIELLTEFDIW